MRLQTLVLSLFIGVYSAAIYGFPPILLNLGEQRSIPVPGLKKFSLGHTSIAKATVLNFTTEKRLLIKAVSPGNTDLWIWNQEAVPTRVPIEVIKITSAPADPKLLRDLFQLQETEVFFTDKKVILRGEISHASEMTLIHALEESYSPLIENWTSIHPQTEDALASKLETFLSTYGLSPRLHLSREGGALTIQGALSKRANLENISRGLRRIAPTVRLDIKSFNDDDPTVHFRAYLLEIKKSHLQKLGLKWPTQGASLFKVTGTQIQSAFQLDVALNALETDGSLNVLSRPEVSVRAPGEAKLFSGGQVPVTHKTKNKTQTEWKPFGLTFHLKVKNTAGERVRLDIETEVSQPDPTWQNTDQIPGFQINQMQTQVDAVFGKPLFLSGLIQQTLSESTQGLPFLKDLPVLGRLFGSRDFQTQKSELVAILLPEHAPPSAFVDNTAVTVRRRKLPRGWIPIPRNKMDAEEEAKLRRSPQFPFNAF